MSLPTTEEQSHYLVVLDDDKGCTKCGHGQFYTIVSGTGEDEMGVGTSWGDKEAAEDICDLMNMAFDAGQESKERIDELKTVARLASELCNSVDADAMDVGGHRHSSEIMRELGPACDAVERP